MRGSSSKCPGLYGETYESRGARPCAPTAPSSGKTLCALCLRVLGLVGVVLACLLLALAQAPSELPDAQAHADQGMHLLQSGDLPGAEAEFRQTVEQAPNDSSYLGTLGAILGMEHKLADSNVYLEKALKISPASAPTRRNLASNQFQLGDLIPARKNLQFLLKHDPADKTSTLLLGMVEEELKDYATAVRLLFSVKELTTQRPESVCALARAYYNVGQSDKARATLQLLRGCGKMDLDCHPERSEGPPQFQNQANTEVLRFAQNDSGGFSRSLLRNPEAVFLGAQVAAQARDFSTAEKLFASIRSTYPDTAKLQFQLARAQYHANQIIECQATLQPVVEAGHATSEVENLLGWCYEGQGDLARAVAAMDKAIAADPAKEANYLDVGRILLEAHRPKGALEAANQALSVAPDSAAAYGLKGLAETQLSQPIDAVQSFLQAVKLDPTSPKALLGLALAQQREGKAKEAQATFEKGIRQFPRHAVFYQEYGKMLLIFRGDDPEGSEAHAIALLSRAVALDNSLADPHFELGNLALSKGRLEEAVTQLEAAAKLRPDDSKTHYALSRAYRRLGRMEDADRELKAFQSLKGNGTTPPG